MMEGFAELLGETVRTRVWIAPLVAFAGGAATAANPCVLAMVPLMIAYVAGQENRRVAYSFLLSLAFSIGLTITFGVLFLVAWAASSLLGAAWWVYVAAAVCLLMGLHLLGVISWQLPGLPVRAPRATGVVGALLLGLLFGLVSLPCAGPMLLALLAIVPLRGAAFGATLLAAYGLGHCLLVIVGGTSMGLVQRLIEARDWQRAVGWIRRGAGVVMVVTGVLLLW